MISVFNHNDLNIRLSHDLRYRIPYRLRTVLIILCSIGFDRFAVYSYAFYCIADLVLNAEYKGFSLFHASRTVYDSCAVFRINGIADLVARDILQSPQLVQGSGIRLRRTAPSHTNQIAVCSRRLLILFRCGWSCRLNRGLCLSRSRRLGRGCCLSLSAFLCFLCLRSSSALFGGCSRLVAAFSLRRGLLCAFLRRCGCFLRSAFLCAGLLSCGFLGFSLGCLRLLGFSFFGLSLGGLRLPGFSSSLFFFLCRLSLSYHRYLMAGNRGNGDCGVIMRFFLRGLFFRRLCILGSLCFGF